MLHFVLCALIGAFGGWLAGMLGIGGGAVLPPLIVFAIGASQHRAQGISLAALLPPVGLPALLAYRERGIRVDARLVVLLVVGFMIGSLGGAWIAHRIPGRELRWAFAVFLIVTAVRALQRAWQSPDPSTSKDPPRLVAGFPIGLVSGVMAGALGVGGGLLALPLIRKFAKTTQLEAQATTLAMMLPPIGLPAVLVYAREEGGLPWSLLAAIALGFALGAAIGGRAAGRVSAKTSAIFYTGLVAVVVATLLTRP